MLGIQKADACIFTRFTRKMLGAPKGRRGSRPSWEEEIATAGKQSTHAWHPASIGRMRHLASKERMLKQMLKTDA